MVLTPDVPVVTEVEPAVALRGVWKTFGAAVALRDVTLTAGPGRIVALLGPNGAGKSTVLRLAAGVTRATRGLVQVHGADPRLNGTRRAIGFAGHRTFLYGALTVAENLRFYAGLYGVSTSAVGSALDRFRLAGVRDRRVQDLSRGFVQRINLARALLHDPAVVLLDEPFTGLDAGIAGELAGLLNTLRAAGRAVLLATHEWEGPRRWADEAVVLAHGRIVLRTPAGALSPVELPALYAGDGGR